MELAIKEMKQQKPGSAEAVWSCNDINEPGPPSPFTRFSGWRHEWQSKDICRSIFFI